MFRSRHRRMLGLLLLLFALPACKVSKPGGVETWLVQKTKHSVTVRGSDQKNPFPASAENLCEGRRIFAYYCVACHGLDGQNTGVPFADKMSPPVPSLKSETVQSYSDGQLKWVIEYGVSPSGMPAAKSILSDDEMWLMVQYIRHLPEKGALGEPGFYSGPNTTATETSSPCTHPAF
jgi:mono/diheme cytochrome c family protein